MGKVCGSLILMIFLTVGAHKDPRWKSAYSAPLRLGKS